MAEAFVVLPNDGANTGKKVRVNSRVVAGSTVHEHYNLIQDLTAVRYSIESERSIAVEQKEKIKRRIGRSPDEGDALVIANFVRKGKQSMRRYGWGILR